MADPTRPARGGPVEVRASQRLPGGASRSHMVVRRVCRSTGRPAGPLVFQQDRPGSVRTGGGMATEARVLRAARAAGSRWPTSSWPKAIASAPEVRPRCTLDDHAQDRRRDRAEAHLQRTSVGRRSDPDRRAVRRGAGRRSTASRPRRTRSRTHRPARAVPPDPRRARRTASRVRARSALVGGASPTPDRASSRRPW